MFVKAPNVIPAASISYTDHGEDGTDHIATESYTFSTKSFGTAAAGRRVIVSVGLTATAGAITDPAVTIGGVSATALLTPVTTSGSGVFLKAGLYIATVPTGVTGDVVVTVGSSVIRCGISVWAAYDLLSSTPTDTAQSTANPMTDSLSVSAKGIGLAYAITYNSGGVPTHTWAGLTETALDTAIEAFVAHSSASGAFASTSTPTVTATPSGFTIGVMVGASLR